MTIKIASGKRTKISGFDIHPEGMNVYNESKLLLYSFENIKIEYGCEVWLKGTGNLRIGSYPKIKYSNVEWVIELL